MAYIDTSPALPESEDLVKLTEKRYRLPPKQSKYERRHHPYPADDFSNVIDLINRENNKPELDELIIEVSIEEINKLNFPDNMKVYTIKNRNGFYILTNCLTKDQQIEYSYKCLKEYSAIPYTNLTNLNTLCPNQSDQWSSPNYSITKFRHLRWANLGYSYNWAKKCYFDISEDSAKLPTDVSDLFINISKVVGIKDYKPESGIVNYYSTLSTVMGCHLDDAEENLDEPVVSISLGCKCIFLMGGPTKDIEPIAVWARSGDAMILSKEARISYHGVPRIIQDIPSYFINSDDKQFNEYMATTRLNINLRQVLKPSTN